MYLSTINGNHTTIVYKLIRIFQLDETIVRNFTIELNLYIPNVFIGIYTYYKIIYTQGDYFSSKHSLSQK